MDGAREGFITAGTWCLDRNITVENWPEEDMATSVLDLQLSGGGSACNFAVDLRRLDPSVQVETMGLLGQDAAGDFLQSVAEANGIAHRFCRSDAAGTQTTDAYVSKATGRRTHILFVGVGNLLSPAHFDFSQTRAKYLHLGLPGIHAVMDAAWQGDANGWVAVLRQARALGIRTNLELVAAEAEAIREHVHPCLPHLDTLVVNDQEIGALAGVATLRAGQPDPAACRMAARQVLQMGAMDLVVVHHTAGAHLVARDGSLAELPSVNVPAEARKGANGAGDAFAAGFFYGLSSNWPAQECLRMAHATAAACLRAPDPHSGIEDHASCLAQADRWGWHAAMA
ncbi:carbohydrate kinase family protein [Tropicimonas sp. IMCC34043]|uniref:carbohydrate kinase family protein n=1 Tax=Tropicimonas sp. IMCC34043 TaxID=2248760 RepID=UPI000E252D3C|nr:carbohydrate kinase family protein [Tropicimonas sp. IMCC34043]